LLLQLQPNLNKSYWLFSNTPRGAGASAITYSIVETAKENELNPYYYLRHLFETLPNIDLTNEDALANNIARYLHCF
jgi:hypothetical protein